MEEKIESGEVEPVVAKPGRRIAHMHKADKRANQRGPITDWTVEVGRDKAEPCYEAIYHVRNPGGFKINEVLYRGRVVVPECVANYLTQMDTEWEKAERALYRNSSQNMNFNVGR